MSVPLHLGYAFDAAAILGIGTPSTDPLPAPEEGFITLRTPDGLSLQALRDSPVGKRLMWRQDWYDTYPWSKAALPSGVYRLRIPVCGSNGKTAAEQAAMLPADETLAPVALVATALLCFRLRHGANPLNDEWTRCAEAAARGCRVVLAWNGGCLDAYGVWGGFRSSELWASSVPPRNS